MSLSHRAEVVACKTPLTKIWEVIADVWHPVTNPSGYVSLGVAENSLMHSRVAEKLPTSEDVVSHDFTYGDGPSGSYRVKKALAMFLNRRHAPVIPVLPQHIAVTNGCSAAIEQLSWMLANPGDVWLLGQPYYGIFVPDLSLRPMTAVHPVGFDGIDPFSVNSVFAYKKAILECQAKGKRVAAMMVCNPHNPLGRCYPRETLVALMRLCDKYKVHMVVDELYALSIWKNTVDIDSAQPVDFISLLSLPFDGVIDPSLIHIVWGMSKDFGANGIRVGMVIDQHNKPLRLALNSTSLYSSVSSLPAIMTAKIFEDDKWVDAYIEENSWKLTKCFEVVAAWARENGIEYTKGANAGFFIWVKLSDVYLQHHPESRSKLTAGVDVNEEITEKLLQNRVFLASGANFGAEETGWYRIIFAMDKILLKEGLKRVVMTLKGERVDVL